MAQTNKDLTVEEGMVIICKIARLLNGVSISQVRYILKQTVILIEDGHTVDVNHPRFKSKINEFEEFCNTPN